MIIKLGKYKRFKQRFKAKEFGSINYGVAFIEYFNLKSQDLGDIRLDLSVLRGLDNREAKKRIEYQLVDWNKI